MKMLSPFPLPKLILAAALAGVVSVAAGETPNKNDTAAAVSGHAVINFANLPHRIDSWQSDGTKGIYLRVGLSKWYYAAFMAPCLELPYHESIGIVTDGLGQVDRFSSIIVGRHGGGPERCWFKSVDEVSGPPGKAKAKPE